MKFLTQSATNQRKFGVVLSYANIFLSTISALIYTPFFLRMMGQAEYGLYSLASSVIGYLAILDFGFGNAVIVYTSKYIANGDKKAEKTLHGTIFSVYLIISIFAIISGFIITYFAGDIFGAKLSDYEISKLQIMFLLLTLNLALTFIFSIYSTILNAYENFIFMKLMNIFRTIMLPALAIPALFLGYRAVCIIVILTVINIVCILADFFYCRKMVRPEISVLNFDFSVLKSIFGYSFFIFLGIVVDQVNWSVANFILGIFCGAKEVAIYAVAIVINGTFITLSVTISSVMLPKVAKMVSLGSKDSEMTDEFIKIARLQFYIIFLITSLFVIFGREFIILWAGKNYEQSYFVALILVLPITIPLIQNLGISILQAKNRVKFRSIGAFLMTFANIAISIPLAEKYGAIGAAIGTGVTIFAFNAVIMNFYYHLRIKLDILKFWRNIFKMMFFMLFGVAFILIFDYFTNYGGLKFLLVLGTLYIIIYTLICVKFIMNDYEISILRPVFAKIRIKI